jgi:hypothetical protein
VPRHSSHSSGLAARSHWPRRGEIRFIRQFVTWTPLFIWTSQESCHKYLRSPQMNQAPAVPAARQQPTLTFSCRSEMRSEQYLHQHAKLVTTHKHYLPYHTQKHDSSQYTVYKKHSRYNVPLGTGRTSVPQQDHNPDGEHQRYGCRHFNTVLNLRTSNSPARLGFFHLGCCQRWLTSTLPSKLTGLNPYSHGKQATSKIIASPCANWTAFTPFN